ncbi:MAG: hypothetical protein ACFFCW_23480 [Candidatus Hodarchaeota archaeon]
MREESVQINDGKISAKGSARCSDGSQTQTIDLWISDFRIEPAVTRPAPPHLRIWTIIKVDPKKYPRMIGARRIRVPKENAKMMNCFSINHQIETREKEILDKYSPVL